MLTLAVAVVVGLAVCGVAIPSSSAASVAQAVSLPRASGAGLERPRTGLPPGAARAAHDREPRLPTPKPWPFPDRFSRTSGTGRLAGGALEWTDWVYDDYGASETSALPLNTETLAADPLSPAKGSFVYPAGAAAGDGADIFRAAIGLTRKASYWRIDWNTLVSPRVPIAEWTFDTDDDASTGSARWPAAANLTSPGIDRALVVSATGAWLENPTTGAVIARFATHVDPKARSFIVVVPRHVLAVSGRWRVRLAAGLAAPSGRTFAVPTLAGALPAPATAARAYNVTFRARRQEPAQYVATSTAGIDQALAAAQSLPGWLRQAPAALRHLVDDNFWSEAHQADALATGDVTPFSRVVDWHRLAARVTTPAPRVTGWSDRWYVTDLHLGQGVSGAATANPTFLSRVQPYEVYVPKGYSAATPLPLTWLLHSADVNYNQYPVINPRLSRQLCQERDSICVSPEGFGGDGLYAGVAEHDFWQVWGQVAREYRVLADRTLITGYSMGGLASFVLPSTYPSVFAASMPLDGGFDDGCSSAPAGAANLVIAAAPDRSANLHWVPLVISDSYTDELSPSVNNPELIQRLSAAADRFTFFSTTAPEHVTTDLLDGFSSQVAALPHRPVVDAHPRTVSYTWCSQSVNRRLGLGPTRVYWLSGLRQRVTQGNALSTVRATDGAMAGRAVTEHETGSVIAPADAPPMQVTTGSWQLGAPLQRSRRLEMTLRNVGHVAVDLAAARLPSGTASVTTDGATRLALTHLRPGELVRVGGRARHASRRGTLTVTLGRGRTRLRW